MINYRLAAVNIFLLSKGFYIFKDLKNNYGSIHQAGF